MNQHGIATFVSADARMHRDPAMTDSDHAAKLAELERLLNDPEVPMQPNRVWSLLDEISAQEMATPA